MKPRNVLKRNISLLIATFFWSITVLAQTATFDFEEYLIDAGLPLVTAPFAADVLEGNGKEVVAIVSDNIANRQLVIYQFNPSTNSYLEKDRLAIGIELHSFDVSEYVPGQQQAIYFLSSHTLYQYTGAINGKPSTIAPLRSVNTLTLKDTADFLARAHFTHNINHDTWPDLIISDFESTQILIGSETGFKLQTLPIKADVIVSDRGTTYATPQLYLADTNQDQLLDIIKIETGSANVFNQQTDGLFTEKAIPIPLHESINGTDWWYKRDANGKELDQSNLSYRKVDEIKDINNDSLPDIIVRFTQSAGVLNRSNDFEVYLGILANDQLGFPKQPSTTISAEGTLADIKFVDINNDKILEVLVSGFDIGLTQIIGALISGSINQDVYIFQQDDASKFSDTPIIQQSVDLKFSLTSGRSGSAIVALGDLDRDGNKELLLSKNTKAISILSGQAGEAAFDKKVKKYKTLIPEDNRDLEIDDLNGDGRDDLLFAYGKLDDAKLANLIKILVSTSR